MTEFMKSELDITEEAVHLQGLRTFIKSTSIGIRSMVFQIGDELLPLQNGILHEHSK
jgi:hypothetical protein